MERLRGLRNFGIVALVALAIALAPGGGTGLAVALWILTVAFFVSIALLGYRLFREHRFTIESLSVLERSVAYGSIALFRMEDDKGIDDKVLCVPLQDPTWNILEELDDLSDQLRDEIAHFFSVYKDLEQKKVRVDGWYSREEAVDEIRQARARHSGQDQDPDNTPSG